MILQLYAPSKHFIPFGKPPHHKGKKTHTIVSTGQKFHLWQMIGQMLISHLWGKPSDLSEFVQFITNQFFFSDLAWSKSQYVYYKPTCIHTHFKNFGPCKTLPFSKYTTKGTLMANGVGYHNHICIKLKTGQVNRQFIHVGNWAKKSSIIQPSALCSFFTWLWPGEKITPNLASSN